MLPFNSLNEVFYFQVLTLLVDRVNVYLMISSLKLEHFLLAKYLLEMLKNDILTGQLIFLTKMVRLN